MNGNNQSSSNTYTQMNHETAFRKAQIAAIELKTQIPYIQVVAIAGSIRRKTFVNNNINLLAITPDGCIPAELAIYLNSLELKVISSGLHEVKAVDLENCLYQFNFCESKMFPCQLNYLTGPEQYTIKLRKKAKDIGYKLNQFGLFKRSTNEPIDVLSEPILYDILGLPYDPPEQRFQ